MSLRTHLVRSVAGTLGITVVNAGLTFVNGVLLARLLGAGGYGIYASAIAVVLVLALPLAVGLDRLLVREVAASSVRDDWSLVRGLIRRAIQTVLPVSLAAVALVGGAAWLSGELDDETLAVLGVALLMIPLLTLSIVRRAIAMGLRHVVSAQLPESIIRPGLFLLLLLGALISWREISPLTAMELNLATVVVAVTLGVVLLWRQLPQGLRVARPAFATRRWLREAIPFAMLQALVTLMNQADVIIVGGLSGAVQAGYYAVAARGAPLAGLGALAANLTLAPTVARLWSDGDRVRLQGVVTRAARGAVLFALAVAAILWLAGPLVLALFGDEFGAAYFALSLLALAEVIEAGLGSGRLVLSMTGHQSLALASALAGVVVRVSIAVALVPTFGATGAAVAAVLAVAVMSSLTSFLALRRTGIDVTPLGLWRARS